MRQYTRREKQNAVFGSWRFHKRQLGLLCCRWAQSANRKTIKGNIWCEVGQPGHSWLNSILFSGLLRSFQTLFSAGKRVRVSVFSRSLARPTSAKSARPSVSFPPRVPKWRKQTGSEVWLLSRKDDWKKESSFWPLRSPADPGSGSADRQESCSIPAVSGGRSRIPRCFAPIKAWKSS